MPHDDPHKYDHVMKFGLDAPKGNAMPINGQHTLADVAALDSRAVSEITRMARDFSALARTRKAPQAWRKSWMMAFDKVRQNFAPAHFIATTKITAYKAQPNVRLSVVPSESEYMGLARAVQPLPGLSMKLARAMGGIHGESAFGDESDQEATVSTNDSGVNGRLNVRATPSASASVLGQFEHGQRITTTGPAQNGFFPVTGPGVSGAWLTGFSSAALLTLIPKAVEAQNNVIEIPEVIITPNMPDEPVYPPGVIFPPTVTPVTPQKPAAAPFTPPNYGPVVVPGKPAPNANLTKPGLPATSANLGQKLKDAYNKNPKVFIAGGAIAATALLAGGAFAVSKIPK